MISSAVLVCYKSISTVWDKHKTTLPCLTATESGFGSMHDTKKYSVGVTTSARGRRGKPKITQTGLYKNREYSKKVKILPGIYSRNRKM